MPEFTDEELDVLEAAIDELAYGDYFTTQAELRIYHRLVEKLEALRG